MTKLSDGHLKNILVANTPDAFECQMAEELLELRKEVDKLICEIKWFSMQPAKMAERLAAAEKLVEICRSIAACNWVDAGSGLYSEGDDALEAYDEVKNDQL